MKKKLKIIIPIIFFICLILTPISIAFITKEIEIGNVITFGNIKMKVIQTTYEQTKEKIIKNKENFDITNNEKINRNVKIENIGNHPMYVRIKINIKGNDKEDNNIDINNYIIIDQKDNNWIKKDEWYYYEKELKENETSKNLEMNIFFDVNKITQDYKGAKFNFEINAEALQSENNNKNVLEAVGWPSE